MNTDSSSREAFVPGLLLADEGGMDPGLERETVEKA